MHNIAEMNEGLHKARSGLIRALVKVEDNKIKDIIISGDFILTPEEYIDQMEEKLLGVEADKEKILAALEDFYSRNDFQSPETHPQDFTEAIMKAIGGGDQ